MREFDISTAKRVECIDITSRIERVVKEKKVTSGMCLVFCPHTTAALTINENADPSVKKDIINQLRELAPEEKGYAHLEGNADAHIKSTLVGHSVQVIIEEGALVLGTWQGIYFCEFDGPRRRKVYVKIIAD